jgi:diadenosine tetraphosphate (Ap4A) HIT family hydrolase
VVFRNGPLRIVQTSEAGFPAFYRVVWNAHVAEFSDLPDDARAECMNAVVEVEKVLRAELQPTKVNIAALGNVVPHLHWHVIARFDWDSHFPAPVWSAPQRAVDLAKLAAVSAHGDRINRLIARAMGS